ncbi:unnamed protein product [Aphanomyces euteiches]
MAHAAAAVVLRCGDLVRAVAAFQRGIYIDMQPFVVFAAFPASVWTCIPRRELDRMDSLLQPWYAAHSTARLPLLFAAIRYMVNICVLHAVYFGHVDVLDQVHKFTKLHWFGYPLMDMAATAGHVECLQFLHGKVRRRCSRRAMFHAVRQGNLPLVHYLLETQEELQHAALDLAAQCGNLALVRMLHKMRVTATTQAVDFAAANGHVDVVEFLLEHRPEGGTDAALIQAARNGHLKVVKFLLDRHGTAFARAIHDAMDTAAGACHEPIVRFLRGVVAPSMIAPPAS